MRRQLSMKSKILITISLFTFIIALCLPSYVRNAEALIPNKDFAQSADLKAFEFEVVRVNARGKIVERRQLKNRVFTEITNGATLEMVSIPGGKFLMGGTKAEAKEIRRLLKLKKARNYSSVSNYIESYKYETPQHGVTVPAFYMSKYEVTQAQWRAVARLPKVNREMRELSDDDRLPATVPWDDAIEFCARLSRSTGRTYSLPSEAEWEYACRAGTTSPFHFGQTITPQLAKYGWENPYKNAPKADEMAVGMTLPVGSFKFANNFGLYDMHGNAPEWCMDPWHENYVGAPIDGSVWYVGGETELRVLRGEGYYNDAFLLRSADRYGVAIDLPNGFRVVVSKPQSNNSFNRTSAPSQP
jgi:formylglycine-generating enzyme required for sulfatase activity